MAWLLSVPLLPAQKETMVYLEQCETLSFDEEHYPNAQLLKGNVRFRHEDALMFCDSAYFYEKDNSLDAFGHVRFVQGDTLAGFGDVLYYNGNTKVARLRHHVRLVHKSTTLTTDSLNYDRTRDLAYYFSGGTIVDSLNILSSYWGQYNPSTKRAVFKTDVALKHPNFTLWTDTLKYNTEDNIADLVGPTRIVYQEETTILSTLGWYNTRTEHCLLLDYSRIIHNNGKILTGDTIFYDKQTGFGRIRHHMEITDSIQKATLYGNYGELHEDGKRGYATDSALFVDWSSEDMLYMHADTLFTEEVPYRIGNLITKDSLLIDSVMTWQAPDTAWQDTAYQQLRAFFGVRIYRTDMQAVCDSMTYNGRDSVMTLYGKPVCWSDENQISADSMKIYLKDGTFHHAHCIGNALAVKQESSHQFDQMAGKEMYAYFHNGELRQVDVNGNAETVFYPREDDGNIIGVNKTQSSYVKIFLEERQIHHIVFTTTTTGTMYPLDSIPPENARLAGFFWAEEERPQQPEDVFRRAHHAPRAEQVTISAVQPETADSKSDRKQRNNRKRRNNKHENRH